MPDLEKVIRHGWGQLYWDGTEDVYFYGRGEHGEMVMGTEYTQQGSPVYRGQVKYVPEIQEFREHGVGITYSDGAYLEGMYSEGTYFKGTVYETDHKTIRYIGEMIYDEYKRGWLRQGYGIEYSDDGVTKCLEGRWESGYLVEGTMYDEQGNAVYRGQVKYIQEIHDYRPHGEGISYCSAGDSLKGIYFEGKYFKGTSYKADRKTISYIGEMIYDEGEKHWLEQGYGIEYSDDGHVSYAGYWKNGEREGYGTCYDEEWKKKWEGMWLQDNWNGRGTLFWNNGNRKLEGTWSNGWLNGYVNVYYLDGKTKRFEGNVLAGAPDEDSVCAEYWPNGFLAYMGKIKGNERFEGTYYSPLTNGNTISRHEWEKWTSEKKYKLIEWL